MKYKFRLVEQSNDSYSIVAYHGSSHKFDKFDISKVNTGHNDGGMWGPGLYFTESESLAKEWNDSGYIYKVQLTFQHPYICKDEKDREKLLELIFGERQYDGDYNYHDMTKFFDLGYDSIVSLNEEWESTDGKKANKEYHDQYVAFKNDQIKILSCEKYNSEEN